MAVDKDAKKKALMDWENAFPQLALYENGKLYKIVGPLIIGIELIKPPHADEYRPLFVMYSLFGNRFGKDIKACLTAPVLMQEFRDKKGFQYSIPYEKHNAFFDIVLDSVREQALLSFDDNIPFDKIASVIDAYSTMPPLSAAPNSYLQAALREAKLKIGLYVATTEAQNVLEQINKISWDEKHFKAFGVDLSKWTPGLEETISGRDEFLKQILINKQDKKIARLKSSELTT